MKTSSRIAFALSIAAALTGCGSSIYVVQKTPQGGTLALYGTPEDAHVKAEAYMRQQCANGFQILEEGDVVVGHEASGTVSPTAFGASNISVTSEDKTEKRIKFVCKGAAPPAASASAPPG